MHLRSEQSSHSIRWDLSSGAKAVRHGSRGDSDRPFSPFGVEGRGDTKEVQILSKGFVAHRARSTWLAWGVPSVATRRTGCKTTPGERAKNPSANSSTMKGPKKKGLPVNPTEDGAELRKTCTGG
jgi:hypothetical protein